MMLEILERSGHIKGWQPASLPPQHTRIRSPCSQESVTEHNSQTWHKNRKECHILGSEPQNFRSKRKAWSLPWPEQDSLPHTGNTSPLMDFPCPLTLANKAVRTQRPHEREGVKTCFHITRDGFVNVIHSAVAVCAWGDLSNLQRLLCVFIQVPDWKFQHPLLVGFTIARRINLPF